jgi:hypothetical protein
MQFFLKTENTLMEKPLVIKIFNNQIWPQLWEFPYRNTHTKKEKQGNMTLPQVNNPSVTDSRDSKRKKVQSTQKDDFI